MSRKITIALDAMGGDHGPGVVVPAAICALADKANLRVILVGLEDVLCRQLDAETMDSSIRERITIHHASQQVGMDEHAANALRGKKDSSMRVAINLVHEDAADACVSAGNTGALMATARFVLKTLPGIDRPAICTAVPSLDGQTHILDLGANVDCTAEHLFQFAVMGAELVFAIEGIERPRIGLLNIGEEAIKGNDQIRAAGAALEASHINYIGFIEGNNIYQGGVDVVVCDGFIGNVALKTSEGLAKMISQLMKQGFKRNLLTRLSGLAALPVLNALRRRIDPRRYNGASLLGLRKIVVKSHGSADVFAYTHAIHTAMLEVENDVAKRIGQEVSTLLEKRKAV